MIWRQKTLNSAKSSVDLTSFFTEKVGVMNEPQWSNQTGGQQQNVPLPPTPAVLAFVVLSLVLLCCCVDVRDAGLLLVVLASGLALVLGSCRWCGVGSVVVVGVGGVDGVGAVGTALMWVLLG